MAFLERIPHGDSYFLFGAGVGLTLLDNVERRDLTALMRTLERFRDSST
jgi:hypothetical protein